MNSAKDREPSATVLSQASVPAGAVFLSILVAVSALAIGSPALTDDSTPPLAPTAPKRPYQVPSPNGTRVDDYYWIRDDSRQSGEVLDYLNKENAYRDAVMASTEALQHKLYDELGGRVKPDDASVPVHEHGYWYYTRFEPGLDYPLYARRKGSMAAAEEVMLDGNAMAKGHEYFHIGFTAVSPDGRMLAYTEDDVGRRQYTLRVKDLQTGILLPDAVTNVAPNLVWAADSRTVLYVEKDPVTLLSMRARKHRLGTHAKRDPLVYEEKDHSYYMTLRKSRSERYLFIQLWSTQQSEWRYADASDPQLRFKTVRPREHDLQYSVEHLGEDFIIRTNWQAPNFRIVRAPITSSSDKNTWNDVISHRNDAFIEGLEVSTGYLFVNERSGGLLKVRIKAWDGSKDMLADASEPAYSMRLAPTPQIGSSTVRYVYTSLITPNSTYEYDAHSGTRELKKTDIVLGGFDAKNYSTEFLHATARDGKQIPISVAYRKGTKLDGSAPLYQYAYGAYGFSTDPEFESDWVSLLDRGFVVAIAHIRGGQELGRQWYEDGRQLHKKNTFNDFIDATTYLVQRGYAAKDKVFAVGASAGGLLMGAVANMAPQAYRAIIAYVPFVDVVTDMLDESIPLVTNEFDEWGNPKERVYYDYMLSYSPYDNVKAQQYPAMLVFTGLWDSQVQYYEPTKWVAKLRATKTDHHTLVFSVDMAAGHGGKSGRFQQHHDTAREYAFILDQLGIRQ